MVHRLARSSPAVVIAFADASASVEQVVACGMQHIEMDMMTAYIVVVVDLTLLVLLFRDEGEASLFIAQENLQTVSADH